MRFPAPRASFFLCSCKERNQRKHAPESPTASCASRRNRRSPNSPGACTRGAPIRGAPVRRHGSPPDFHEYSASPSGSIKSLATAPIPAAMLGGGYGDPKKPSRTLRRAVFKSRMAHPSIASLWPSARRGARGIARMARRHREVPSGHRRARGAKRRRMLRHPGCLSFW